MGWLFGSGPGDTGPDRDSARWSTAVHEASHVVAVRRAGGTARATLSGNGRRGSYSGALPDPASPVADAIVHLAGGIGQRRLVGRDGLSGSDLAQARRALRGTGVSLGEARRHAARLVSGNRAAIEREARRLYGTGGAR